MSFFSFSLFSLPYLSLFKRKNKKLDSRKLHVVLAEPIVELLDQSGVAGFSKRRRVGERAQLLLAAVVEIRNELVFDLQQKRINGQSGIVELCLDDFPQGFETQRVGLLEARIVFGDESGGRSREPPPVLRGGVEGQR